ncbi:MAG: hypothetical protein K5764_06610 [Prevotella sp.]|nr:hypothetical protein [Prevotella sp.]
MKYNKLSTVLCSAALGLLTLTSCEGGDLFSINGPDWMSEKIDSISASKKQGGEEEKIEGLHEDVYNIGAEDLTSGFFTLGKTYVIPAGEMWQAQFNLTVNPDNKYFKNFYIVLNAYNAEKGELGDEYGVIRYDNDPTKNSEWNTVGTEIDRSKIGGNFQNSSGADDVDASVQKMNGKVTLTVDRADGGLFIKMSNGTLTKTYMQTNPFPSTGSDIPLACRIGIEGSLVSFLGSTIEPIGGYTSKEDKQPLTLDVSGVPGEVLVGTEMEDAFANVIATVTFEQGVTKKVTAEELLFETIPNFEELGQKTLVVMYNKTFKGVAAEKPAVVVKTFNVVSQLSAFTESVVVPKPYSLGADDCSVGWWSEFTENIKVEPMETKVVHFTNYTSTEQNYHNFAIILNKQDLTEYGVVRADNWGWGAGIDNNSNFTRTMTPTPADDNEWATWRQFMNGARVTAYITNNGDGTAEVKYTATQADGTRYDVEYKGINTIDADNFYFRFTLERAALRFDHELGAEDLSTGWWSVFTPLVQVKARQSCTFNFTNYTSTEQNYHNFAVILNKADLSEYGVVRADCWGWGAGIDGNDSFTRTITPAPANDDEWAAWRQAMNGAKINMTVSNKGDGTADITLIMKGTNGVEYTVNYTGINTIDPDNFFFRLTVERAYLWFVE